MPVFSVNMEHAVESCPLFNAEVMKKFRGVIGKREGEALTVSSLMNSCSKEFETSAHRRILVCELF